MFTITVIVHEDYFGAKRGDYDDYDYHDDYHDDYDDDVSSTIGDDRIRQSPSEAAALSRLLRRVMFKVIAAKNCNA